MSFMWYDQIISQSVFYSNCVLFILSYIHESIMVLSIFVANYQRMVHGYWASKNWPYISFELKTVTAFNGVFFFRFIRQPAMYSTHDHSWNIISQFFWFKRYIRSVLAQYLCSIFIMNACTRKIESLKVFCYLIHTIVFTNSMEIYHHIVLY